MDEESGSKVSAEVIKELRNDFTFFVASSILKTLALNSTNPKEFIRDIVWKWREMQVNTLGAAVSDMERKMSADEEFNQIFGEMMKKANRAQREVLVSSIRMFCDNVEKILVSGLDTLGFEKEEEDFTK